MADQTTLGPMEVATSIRQAIELDKRAAQINRLRAALERITDSEADTSNIGVRRWTAAMHQECVKIAQEALRHVNQ